MVASGGLLGFLPFISVVIYIIGLGSYWLMAFFVLYHLIRFGVSTGPKKLALTFLLGSIVLSIVATGLFLGVDVNLFK